MLLGMALKRQLVKLKKFCNPAVLSSGLNDMARVKLINVDDIGNNDMTQVTVDDRNYLVAKVDNEIYVTSDMCTHEDAELTMGCLKGIKVKCPLHGSFFDLRSGKPLNEPAEEPIKVYKTKIENNCIYLDE